MAAETPKNLASLADELHIYFPGLFLAKPVKTDWMTELAFQSLEKEAAWNSKHWFFVCPPCLRAV